MKTNGALFFGGSKTASKALKALVALAVTASALFLSASCSRQNSGGVSETADAEAPLELRYGFTTEPDTFDPLSPANTADGRSILFNVFEGLVKPDSSGVLIPAMAESYKIEENALVYSFTLREGITFHDGKPLEADDVLFSINTAAENGFDGLDNIALVESPNKREIRIRLKEADTEFLPYLTVGIVPADKEDREINPVGTGPFRIGSYAAQEYLKLVKNPSYWQSGLPKLDSVTVVFAADTDALFTGLMGGNIEGASVTGSLLPRLDSEKFDFFPWSSNTVQLMALNNAEKPFDDIRVRRALNYSVDINSIIETAFYGKGEPSGSALIPGLKNVYNEALRDPYPRNIALAKTLLEEAGYPGGFSFEITVPSNYTMHVDTAQVITGQLAEAGISASIRLVDWGTWIEEIYRGRKYQATIISLDAGNVSPRSFLSRYVSTEGNNFLNFRSEEYDRVYAAALAEIDEAKRNSLYMEAQRIISDNAAGVYIQDITGFMTFTGGRFGGAISYPLYVIDFSSIYRK